jgi:hypothetical protein
MMNIKKTLLVIFSGVLFFSNVLYANNPYYFDHSDLDGTWDLVYYYSSYPSVPTVGYISINNSGEKVTGMLTTEGGNISSGDMSMDDLINGDLSGDIISKENTITISGVMNTDKDVISGSWDSDSGYNGTLTLQKRPRNSTFNSADFTGTWDLTYYYTGSDSEYLGVGTFDGNSKLTNGRLITEEIDFLAGGCIFTDYDNGTAIFSGYYIYNSFIWVTSFTGAMNADKNSISGNWNSWHPNSSGKFILTKHVVSPGDEGGGGCFINNAIHNGSISPKIKNINKIRDSYLLKNKIENIFIKWYYKINFALNN